MITEKEFSEAIDVIISYKKQVLKTSKKMFDVLNEIDFLELEVNEDSYIRHCGFSVRAINCLLRFDENLCFLKDINKYSKSELFNTYMIGEKTIQEIESKLLEAGIVLKD